MGDNEQNENNQLYSRENNEERNNESNHGATLLNFSSRLRSTNISNNNVRRNNDNNLEENNIRNNRNRILTQSENTKNSNDDELIVIEHNEPWSDQCAQLNDRDKDTLSLYSQMYCGCCC